MSTRTLTTLACERCDAELPAIEGNAGQARAVARQLGWKREWDKLTLRDLCPDCLHTVQREHLLARFEAAERMRRDERARRLQDRGTRSPSGRED